MNSDGPDFVKLLAQLNRHGVEYLVVGGVAVAFNGYVRTTEDLDILIVDSAANVARLASALQGFGEGYGGNLSVDDFPPEEGAVRILQQDCPLDVFNHMAGHSYADFLPQRGEARVPGVEGPVRYLNCAALRMLKAGSMGEKDRLDLMMLERLDQGLTPE